MADDRRVIALQAAVTYFSGGTVLHPPSMVLEHADAYLAWLTKPRDTPGWTRGCPDHDIATPDGDVIRNPQFGCRTCHDDRSCVECGSTHDPHDCPPF